MATLLVFAQVLSFVAGCILCYAALFLYEDEARAIQNVLEEWWVRVDDLRAVAVKRHIALLRISAEATTSFLDRLFGKRLVSLQAVAVSGTLSLVSLYVVTNWLQTTGFRWALDVLPQPRAGSADAFREAIIFTVIVTTAALLMSAMPERMWALSLVAVGAILIASVRPRLRFLPALVFVVLLSVFVLPLTVPSLIAVRYGTPDIVLTAALTGIVFDVATILVIRRVLRWQMRRHSPTVVSVAATLQIAIAVGVVVIPVFVGVGWAALSFPAVPFNALAVAWSATTNLFACLLALSLFATLCVFMLHVLVWPAIERPLYQLAALGLFRTRSTRMALFAVGSTLLLLATGRIESIVEPLVKLLGAG